MFNDRIRTSLPLSGFSCSITFVRNYRELSLTASKPTWRYRESRTPNADRNKQMDKSVTDTSGEIFIVDDDPEACTALSILFNRAGYLPTVFTDGKAFVSAARKRVPACVLLDICMPTSSGLDILVELDARSYSAPVLILSGRSDIASAVQAIKSGAFDFIEKRMVADTIVARVRASIDRWMRRQQNEFSKSALPAVPGYDLLTSREREVLSQITAAASIKETARNLGISPRTVAVHRRRIMRKLSAKNSVNLMRTVMNMAHSM
jgi:two-component system, LuxR family, response regulator FixJ